MSRRSGKIRGMVKVGKFRILDLQSGEIQIVKTSRYGRPKEMDLRVAGVQEVKDL